MAITMLLFLIHRGETYFVVAREFGKEFALPAFLQFRFECGIGVEELRDRFLPTANDETNIFDPNRETLINKQSNDRHPPNRKQFLRHSFRPGEETGAKASHR